MSDILPHHLAFCLQSLILFCCRRFSEMLLLPVSMIECWLAAWHAVQKWQTAEKSQISSWKRYCSWTSTEQNKFLLIQKFACGICLLFYLQTSLGNRMWETDFWLLASVSSTLYNSTLTLFQNSFSRLVMISVGTPYRQIHVVKIAFATVSGVPSEMATYSSYFENASVNFKMYLLLLPETTGAAIMSKCTSWWVKLMKE